MKYCPKCKHDLDESMFSKNSGRKDGLQPYCKECRKAIDANSYKASQKRRDTIVLSNTKRIDKNKKFVEKVKGKGCCKCDETEKCTLDFHHIKGSDKKFDIASGIQSNGLEAIKNEIRKCILVCSNCHRKIHAGILQE